METDQLIELLEPLPMAESEKTTLLNRIQEEGVSELLLDDIEQILSDAQKEFEEEAIEVSGQMMVLEAYEKKIDQIITEARVEIDKIDAAEESIMSGLEDLADQLEAQDAVDNA